MKLPSVLLVLIVITAYCDGFDVEISPRDIGVKQTGHPFFVSCLATSEKSLAVTWKKEDLLTKEVVEVDKDVGSVYQSRSNGRSLLMFHDDYTDLDQGVYICEATDGSTTETARALIEIVPEIGFADCEEIQYAIEGQEMRIKCVPTGAPEVIWTSNGDIIEEGNAKGLTVAENMEVLVIPEYHREEDDGVYGVQLIQISTGDVRNREINVIGRVLPQVLMSQWVEAVQGMEGHPLRLRCNATGSPAPTFIWYKGSEVIDASPSQDQYTQDNGELTINSLVVLDAAVYTCEAKNGAGSSRAEVNVTVYEAPKIDPLEDTMTVRKGKEIEINCTYRGDRPIHAHWLFGNTMLPRTETVFQTEIPYTDGRHWVAYVEKGGNEYAIRLRIKDVVMDDAMRYRCQVRNDAGTQEESVMIHVNHSPMKVRTSEPLVRTLLGEKVVMMCEVQAVPTPGWTWTFNGQNIDSSVTRIISASTSAGLQSNLTIPKVTAEHLGKYQCVGDNQVPEAFSQDFEMVEIQAPPQPKFVRMPHDLDVGSNWMIVTIENLNELEGATQPDEVILRYAPVLDAADDDMSLNATEATIRWEPDGRFKLSGLLIHTSYKIRASAVNRAGQSEFSEPTFIKTNSPSVPDIVTLAQDVDESCSGGECKLSWNAPNDNGAEITVYYVQWMTVDDENKTMGEAHYDQVDPSKRSYTFESLLPDSRYLVRLVANNDVGEGPTLETYISTPKAEEFNAKPGTVSTGAIVVIVILILIIVLFLVDLSCYHVNQCGVIMSICINCCGKTPPAQKAKEHAIEGGLSTQEKSPLQEKSEEEKGASNETEPMLSEKSSKNTVV